MLVGRRSWSLWPAPSRGHSAWGGEAWESLFLSPAELSEGGGIPASPALAVLCFFFFLDKEEAEGIVIVPSGEIRWKGGLNEHS